jgi:beta-phosphoglucomutase
MNEIDAMLKQMEAAIFDMDGTMVRNMTYHKKAWQEYLAQHGIHLSEDEFREKISGKKNDQIFELVFGRKLSEEELAKYTAEKEQLYRDLYAPDIKEVEGLTSLITALCDRNIKIAIATTSPAANRQFVLKSLGLENKFQVILGDEHVRRGKPDPEIYISTANELSVPPSKCVVFEDSPPGVQSGKAAGMTVVGLLTSHSAEELPGADYLIRDFTGISI